MCTQVLVPRVVAHNLQSAHREKVYTLTSELLKPWPLSVCLTKLGSIQQALCHKSLNIVIYNGNETTHKVHTLGWMCHSDTPTQAYDSVTDTVTPSVLAAPPARHASGCGSALRSTYVARREERKRIGDDASIEIRSEIIITPTTPSRINTAQNIRR